MINSFDNSSAVKAQTQDPSKRDFLKLSTSVFEGSVEELRVAVQVSHDNNGSIEWDHSLNFLILILRPIDRRTDGRADRTGSHTNNFFLWLLSI